MQRCLVKGAIQLRRPSGSTAPDVEEMILTLVDLVDMDADHRATMSRSEFCSIFSLLHASVLPIVPQVTHQKDKSTMTIHMDEQEIKGNVQRCPYFRPQSEILNYQDTRRRNVEGFVENLKTREWEDFLNGLKGGQARAAKKAAAAGGTKWVEFLRDHIATEEQSPLIALLSPTSVVKPFNDSFIDSLRLLATEAERLATDATRAIEAIKPIAAELAVTKNNAHKAMTYMNRDVMLHAADAAATAAATAAGISRFATNDEATEAAKKAKGAATKANEAADAAAAAIGIGMQIGIGNETEAKNAAVAATEKAANATKEAVAATDKAAHIADVVHKDVVRVTGAAVAASGEWNSFLGTLPSSKKGIAMAAYNNSISVEGWNEWIGVGYMDWGRDILNTAWKTAGVAGVAAAGVAGVAAAGVAGVAAASALGSNKAEPTQASTPQAPIPRPQAPTPTPQAPTPTHAFHAGVQVGLPDGSLALHIDGPTMGTRAGAAKRQKTQ